MKVYILKVGTHFEAWTDREFVCSGDTYKECREEVLAMGLEVR